MVRIESYKFIIDILCKHYKISNQDLINLLKNKEYKYLLLLLLNEYGCLEKEKLINESIFSSNKSITYNLKKAEEKLLINKQFRNNYIVLDKVIKDN